MKRFVGVQLVVVLLLVAGAVAGVSIRKTKITFSQPVRVPGVLLKAGTYYFSAPEFKNRALIRIQDENGTVIAQFMGIAEHNSNYDHPMIVFGERACGTTAIKSWSYPSTGLVVRFVYSREEASSIAASCNEPVPETAAKVDARSVESSSVRLMTPQGTEQDYDPKALASSDQRDKNGLDPDPQ